MPSSGWAVRIGGTLWRTAFNEPETWDSLLMVLDENEQSRLLQPNPGKAQKGFNDPDMMDIGVGTRSISEERAFFSLWCLIKAPLLLSTDLRDLDAELRAVVLNHEVFVLSCHSRSRALLPFSCNTCYCVHIHLKTSVYLLPTVMFSPRYVTPHGLLGSCISILHLQPMPCRSLPSIRTHWAFKACLYLLLGKHKCGQRHCKVDAWQ